MRHTYTQKIVSLLFAVLFDGGRWVVLNCNHESKFKPFHEYFLLILGCIGLAVSCHVDISAAVI